MPCFHVANNNIKFEVCGEENTRNTVAQTCVDTVAAVVALNIDQTLKKAHLLTLCG